MKSGPMTCAEQWSGTEVGGGVPTLEVAPGDLVARHPVGGPPGQADGVDLDVHQLHLPHGLDQLRTGERG